MPRRRFADVMSSSVTGAASMGKATGGDPWAMGGGAVLGGIGGYFASKADEPFDEADLALMRAQTAQIGVQNKLGMAELEALQDAGVERRRKERARKNFANILGRGFTAARTVGNSMKLVGA